jgi:hypothetical protein
MIISNFVTKKDLHEYIESNYGKILFVFSIWHHLYSGDDFGYIIQNFDNERKVLLSKNDELYISDEQELQLKIAEYSKAIVETKKAICLLNR